MAITNHGAPAHTTTIKVVGSSGTLGGPGNFTPNSGSAYVVCTSLFTNQSGVAASTVAWSAGGSGTWKIMTTHNANQFSPTIEIWAVHCSTAPGTSNISVTGNADVSGVYASIIEFTGHDPTLPTTGGGANSDSSPFNTITVTPTSTGGLIVVSALDTFEGFTPTANAATQIIDSWNNGGAEQYSLVGSSNTVASTNQTLGLTNTMTNNSQVAIEFLPAAAAASIPNLVLAPMIPGGNR